VDWAAVETSAKTKIPAAIAYTLSWGSPRSDGMTITTSFSAKTLPNPRHCPDNCPGSWQKGVTDSLKRSGRGWPLENSAPPHNIRF
ncbi:MAG: hypothetical protein LBG27_06805, partial [Spirochaetaceae bacterium]|nr:hypothetical protein [Spirochaetaceae bacterium]